MTRPLHRIHEDLICDIRCIEHRYDNAIKTLGTEPIITALNGLSNPIHLPFGWHNGLPVLRGCKDGLDIAFDGGTGPGSVTIEWLGYPTRGTYDAQFNFDIVQNYLGFEGRDILVYDDVVTVDYAPGLPLHIVANRLLDGAVVDTCYLMVNGVLHTVSSASATELSDNTILYGEDFCTAWLRIYDNAMETTEMTVLYEHAKRTIPSDTWRPGIEFIAPPPA